MLLEKWMADPIDCCESMGLQTPLSALRHGKSPFGEPGATLEASLEYLEVSSNKFSFFTCPTVV